MEGAIDAAVGVGGKNSNVIKTDHLQELALLGFDLCFDV